VSDMTALREKLAELDAREARIDRWRKPLSRLTDWLHKPLRERLDAIGETREELLAAHGTEIIGCCETCDRIILEGEPWANGGEGMKLCADHAPTWADLAKHYRDLLATGDSHFGDVDADELREWLADAEGRIAAGQGGETVARL
jgi:hypothetical protein